MNNVDISLKFCVVSVNHEQWEDSSVIAFLLFRAESDEFLAHLPELLRLLVAPCRPRRRLLLAVAVVGPAAVLNGLLEAAVDRRL